MSVSLGASSRDKTVEIELPGARVRLERRGTDGDLDRARALYRELDGRVDAFGVGGVEVCLSLPWKDYPLRSGLLMTRDIEKTPFTDGRHLKKALESRVMRFVDERIGHLIPARTAFLVEAVSRYGMLQSFLSEGYECVFGDLMFALGLPLPIRTPAGLERTARLLLPLVSRLPISMLYSTGESQAENVPKYEEFYRAAAVVAGDWLYIRRHMPEDMEGKVVVTNTTTEEDVAFMRARGVRWLVTTTPVFEGRSFGTNALEAALIAASGAGRVLEDAELAALLDRLGIEPTIRELR